MIGLAFSGGGIRSATFNLGVLQGLAEHDVLKEVDYLSTVSGGGYIGAWFLSLLRVNGAPEQVQQVQKTLKQKEAHHPESPGQDAIHVLRQFSNYLTPRFIFYSADVWTAVATWTRNTLLNLIQLIATIAVPLLVARLLGFWLFVGATRAWEYDSSKLDLLGLLGTLICLLFAALCVCANLLSKRGLLEWSRLGKRIKQWRQLQIQLFVVCPLLAAGVFLSHWLRNTPDNLAHDGFWSSIMPPALLLFACYMTVSVSGGLWSCFRDGHPGLRGWYWPVGFLILLLASVVPAFVTALLLWSAATALESMRGDPHYPWLLLTWGPPLTLMGLALGEVVQLGIIGRDFSETAREWFGRLRAWTLIYSFGWIIVFGASIYGPLWMEKLWNSHPWAGQGLTVGWLVTTIGGVLSARSMTTGGTSNTSNGGRNPLVDWIARIAPFVFIAGFVLAIACGVHFLLTWDLNGPPATSNATQPGQLHVTQTDGKLSVDVQLPVTGQPQTRLDQFIANYFRTLSQSAHPMLCLNCTRHFLSAPLNLLGVLAIVVTLLGFRLDINVFSLHEFYKNRLVRCYLGATRWKDRRPDPFTGFDEDDDVLLKQFHSGEGRYFGPYPIVNATMNVSAGENLAWQERKSVPFILTPRYSGYNAEKSGNEAMRLDQMSGPTKYAYRPTEAYCYPAGIHLGTAVAVSGAAANPNQGYHTSTAVAFLMTVFDVRLGWWVGNPRSKHYDRATPRFNLTALASELFGVTTADSSYVNLSDGGHFDNMGLYELVRRRCRYIIVSDAEQDGDLTFGSMTSVVRNCRMDFGVEIKIDLERITKDEKGYSRTHCVVGRIEVVD